MNFFNTKSHWENIYETKESTHVSWFQPVPQTSLSFLEEARLPKNAKIIDVGGGDSLFVDHLLEAGYTDITVLDISANALQKAKTRLGEKAAAVKWIVSDVSAFVPGETYDFWHDRAVFHFLTEENDIANYMAVLSSGVEPGGMLVMGTFSEYGPTKCSGIPIKQYSERSLTDRLKAAFDKVKCLNVDHRTPFDTVQQFVFCSFLRKGAAIG